AEYGREAGPPDLLHQLLHLLELTEQRVHLLHRGAAALGDPAAPAAVDGVRPAALVRGHALDDRLDPVELLLVDLGPAQLRGAPEPRSMPRTWEIGPIRRTWRICSRKSWRVSEPPRIFCSSFLA